MRMGSVVMLVVALGFGLLAAIFAKIWLEGQTPPQQVVTEKPAVPLTTIVVANRPLRFGTELTRSQLSEVEWPKGTIPEGSFSKISDILDGQGKRLVLSAIAKNEPVIRAKVTGPGQRASLSALVSDGFTAAAIRVNDVLGVAGFVLPGDRVDVLLTREEKGEVSITGGGKKAGYTDVLLQNVRVLAVDQLADDQASKPSLSKTVTVEVDLAQAQKLALGSSVGMLSLALKGAGATMAASARRITLSDLRSDKSVSQKLATLGDRLTPGNPNALIGVTRSTERHEYVVPHHPR